MALKLQFLESAEVTTNSIIPVDDHWQTQQAQIAIVSISSSELHYTAVESTGSCKNFPWALLHLLAGADADGRNKRPSLFVRSDEVSILSSRLYKLLFPTANKRLHASLYQIRISRAWSAFWDVIELCKPWFPRRYKQNICWIRRLIAFIPTESINFREKFTTWRQHILCFHTF